MKARFKIPQLINHDIVIRKARSREEIDAANRLVFENYVKAGYWEKDDNLIVENPWINSEHREVFVATDNGEVVGTFSIIHDSQAGLPSDSVQPMWLRRFRQQKEQLAEGSAFAIRSGRDDLKNLQLFLMACYLQYSFYHTRIERLVQVCRPVHARFYSKLLRFEKHGGIIRYDYVHTQAQFLSLDLLDAHRVLSEHYEPVSNGEPNLYRFLLTDQHQAIELGQAFNAHRPREFDWVSHARDARESAAAHVTVAAGN